MFKKNKNHVITRKDNEQVMNGLKQSDIVIPNTPHQCHTETLTRICNVHSGSRTNSALSQRERAKDVKNLSPYSPLTICYPCHDYSTCIRKTLVQSYCFHLFK